MTLSSLNYSFFKKVIALALLTFVFLQFLAFASCNISWAMDCFSNNIIKSFSWYCILMCLATLPPFSTSFHEGNIGKIHILESCMRKRTDSNQACNIIIISDACRVAVCFPESWQHSLFGACTFICQKTMFCLFFDLAWTSSCQLTPPNWRVVG